MTTPLPAPYQANRTPVPPPPRISYSPPGYTFNGQNRQMVGRFTQPTNRFQSAFNRIPDSARVVNVPSGMPRFLADRNLLLTCWFVAMILVSSDEYKQGFIFPRPARLWYTSLAYGLLMVAASIDSLAPICNAIGIGLDVTLAYEAVSGNGLSLFGFSFSGGSVSAAAPAAAAVGAGAAAGAATGINPGVVTSAQARIANSQPAGG